MATEKVMLIRHGEKPDIDAGSCVPPFGLLEDGAQSRYGLTPRGWQRAGALALLFGPEGAAFRPKSLATPDVVFASAIGPHSRSLRMQQTIAPLQAKLGSSATINIDYLKQQETAMVAAALECEGNVLICWSHEGIPQIAKTILRVPIAAPMVWPEQRYDLVWVFDRPFGAPAWTFHQVPQMLLAGDSTELIS